MTLLILNAFFVGLAVFLIVKTFFNIYFAYNNYQRRGAKRASTPASTDGLFIVELIRPLVFTKLFATSLTISFFSQFILQITRASHLSDSMASVSYVMYQIAFVCMIVPSGYFVEIKNIKKVLLLSTLLEGLVFLGFGFAANYWMVILLQLAIGLLIPISSSVDYAYIFRFSSDLNRTKAISLYANTLMGASIAGIVMGGHIAHLLNQRTVFFVIGFIDLVCLGYIWFFLPAARTKRAIDKGHGGKAPIGQLVRHLPGLLKDQGLVKVIVLVALPLGILGEGAVRFGLPIVLTHQQFPQVMVGYIIAAFSVGFFITNKSVARVVDRIKRERPFLTVGLLGLLLGLCLMGVLAFFKFHEPYSASIIAAIIMLILGMFRGFLVSPSISFVSKRAIAETIGKNLVMSFYNLFETIGKIIGPLLMMVLLIVFHYSFAAYIVLGSVYLAFALLFFCL